MSFIKFCLCCEMFRFLVGEVYVGVVKCKLSVANFVECVV